MSILSMLLDEVRDAVTRRAIQAHRLRSEANGEPCPEPLTATIVRPVSPFAFEVVVVGPAQASVGTYRVGVRGAREYARPARVQSPRKPRPDTVVRLPRKLVERVAELEGGESTVHQKVERVLLEAIERRNTPRGLLESLLQGLLPTATTHAGGPPTS
jgi:hypothetical protein